MRKRKRKRKKRSLQFTPQCSLRIEYVFEWQWIIVIIISIWICIHESHAWPICSSIMLHVRKNRQNNEFICLFKSSHKLFLEYREWSPMIHESDFSFGQNQNDIRAGTIAKHIIDVIIEVSFAPSVMKPFVCFDYHSMK